MIIQIDSREKGNKYILDYFDSIGQKYIVSKMYAGDYQNVISIKILIDRKQSLLEIAGNLCRTTEHNRIKREIAKACDIGAERFIFLIADSNITSIQEVCNWKVPTKRDGTRYTRVEPKTLQKIMETMAKKYRVEFIFCKKKDMGQVIINLLGENNEEG